MKSDNQTPDTITEAVARAWASMDGKPFDDPEYRDGYIADAEELLERLGLAARLAAAEADINGIIAIFENERELRKKAEAERDEAQNQLDSARHSIDVLERNVARARAERDAAMQEGVKALVEALDVARDGLEWAEAHLMDHGTISATVSYATQKTRAALSELGTMDANCFPKGEGDG